MHFIHAKTNFRATYIQILSSVSHKSTGRNQIGQGVTQRFSPLTLSSIHVFWLSSWNVLVWLLTHIFRHCCVFAEVRALLPATGAEARLAAEIPTAVWELPLPSHAALWGPSQLWRADMGPRAWERSSTYHTLLWGIQLNRLGPFLCSLTLAPIIWVLLGYSDQIGLGLTRKKYL